MAKLKSKIASKYKAKPKRKFVDGGPYTDVEKELYLNDNVTYQASTPPTAMLQNKFDAQEQEKAKRMTAIYGDQFARQLDYLQDQTAAAEQRKQEETTARKEQSQANTQEVNKQISQTGAKAAKNVAKDAKAGLFKDTATPFTNAALQSGTYYSPTWAPVTPAPVAPVAPAPVLVNPAMQTATSTTGELFAGTPTVGQNLATTTSSTGSAVGQNLAAIGKSAGTAALVAAPQIAGQIAYNQLNKADDKQMQKEGRSQYYDDTHYSKKEYSGQVAKSAGKGATIGGTIGSVIPGVGTGIGMAVGTIVGTGAGLIKAQHQRRMTKSEDERGVKLGNKRFGKKLLFGEENVYDKNLDPTVIEKRNREAQLQAMTDTANALDNARMSSMMQSDVNTGFGLKNSTFEAKYGGNIKYLKGGVAKSLGRGAVEYVGKKHEHGGIDLPGNIEVEGGETEQNDYVFSATLKLPNGETYAKAHKKLIKSGATGEEIHQLALSQEAAAGRNPNQIKGMKFAKYGGPLQYDKGGKKEPDIVVGGRSKEYWQNLSAFCAKNPRHYSCLSGDDGTTGNEARKVNGVNQGIALEMLDEQGNPVNTYEDYLKAIKKSRRGDFVGGRSYGAVGTNYDIVKDGKYTEEELENMPLDKYMEIAAPYIDEDTANISYINGDAFYKGLLPNLSKEEFEFYRGQRNNPNTTIPNPANGTTLPNADLWSEDPFGKPVMGATQGVESQSNNKPAVDESGRLATPRPITQDEYEFYLREKAAKEANETRQASEYGPMLKGKDITTLPRKQAQLAQYNLPNINPGPTSTTFVPDEEVTTSTQPTVTNPPVITVDNAVANPPVTTATTTNTQTTNTALTYNSQNKTFTNVAKTKGALDYTERDKAGDIFAGENYQNKWLPLVEASLNDDAKADQILNFLENYTGQDAADTKAKLAGKTRAEKIAITRRLASDGKPGPFHNAVESAINSIETPPPPPDKPGEVPKENPKDESTPPPTTKDYTLNLPEPPKYNYTPDKNYIGLVQAIPSAYAIANPIKTKDIAPSVATGYVQPGSVGRITLGRVQYNAERAANQQNQAAMNQALQNMSGPGAVAGMLAAKTKADQQSMQIAQAEQNVNMGRAGEEAKINAGISQFNVGQAMAAQQTNAQLAQMNAARIQEANKFNTQLRYARDVENREQILGALDRGSQSVVVTNMANRGLKRDYDVAATQDYSGALMRYLEQQKAAQTKQTTEEPNKQLSKFGGVKKYVSRLGDLKNNRTFKA